MRRISPFLTILKGAFIASLIESLPLPSHSQTRLIDSLLTVLKTSKQDTSKAMVCGLLCRAYMTELNDMVQGQVYAEKAFTISERIQTDDILILGIRYH